MREVAKLNYEGKVKAVQEESEQGAVTLDFGAWKPSSAGPPPASDVAPGRQKRTMPLYV
jgi:hypothetical protein